ncbi:MAG: hypothetical protein ABI550_09700 [Ignavibacteriaceae bacterium]
MKYIFPFFLLINFIFLSCGENKTNEINKEFETNMNSVAESYIKLVLKIGQHDPDYIDAYYGPNEFKPASLNVEIKDSATIQNLYNEAGKILDELDSLGNTSANEIQILRFTYLYKQLLAARTKLVMLAGGELNFDEEAKAIYDTEVPTYSNEHFQQIIDELDNELPGNGTVSEKLNEFKKSFIIPKEKLDTVFQTAINECRKRTLQHIQLPNNENFSIEYVTNKPWGGYNWYKGNSYSLIQVNTDLPIYIDRALDIAAHEGYPGHHVYNLLLEKELYRQRGWKEFSVYVLFSPQSLIAEGSANYGIKVAFPGNTRVKFEREVLFPLAGLDEKKADKYYQVLDLTSKLNFAGNEAARNYLNKKWTKEETINWLIKYALSTKEKAEKNISFYEKYRSYVINYNVGQKIIEDYIIKKGGSDDNPELRWKLFEKILSTPQTPSGLQK